MKNINTNTREVLKSIPSVDLIILDCYKKFNITFPYLLLKKVVKDEIKSIKSEIVSENIITNVKERLYKNIYQHIKNYSKHSLTSIINGTGIVLHTGLGRSPIDKAILNSAIDKIYPYSNLEFNIFNNKRGERNNHISYLINSMLSCEASIIVNNNAAAVLLALNTLSDNKEVIISRGELVEIGGSFRIPDVIKKANCKMVEVGTTNKTHLKDFKNSINDKTGLIMIAHTSNYKVVGFTESVLIKDLVELGKKKKIPVFLDLGSGAMINYDKYGLPEEKLIQEYIKMGVDLVSFSGDKLLGGIQSGIICGKKKLVRQLHDNSMYRALRCDKMTISIMEGILRTYIRGDDINKYNLAFQLLVRTRLDLEKNAKKILRKIDKKIIDEYNIKYIKSYVQAGSGSLPIENIDSIALTFQSKKKKPTIISSKFRLSNNPTIGYIKGNKFHIDLKAIPNDQINILIDTIINCLG